MEAKELKAADIAADGEAVGMEDLFWVMASPNPSLLSLVSQEEAVERILLQAETIGIQGNGGYKKIINRGTPEALAIFLPTNQLRDVRLRWRRRRQRRQRWRRRTIQPGHRSG